MIAVTLCTNAPAHADDEVLASLAPSSAGQIRLSAYGGHVVWSQPDASGAHVLMRWRAGELERLPVKRGALPFDVNVGPDARGRAVAVYSRADGIYRLPLSGGRERKVARLSGSSGAASSPALWRGDIAFASRAGRAVTVKLLRRGARRAIALARVSPERLGQDPDAQWWGIGGMDLTSNALVFETGAGGYSELRRIALPQRRSTVIDRGFIQEANALRLLSPNVTPRETLWVRQRSTPCDETTVVSHRAGRRRSTPPTPQPVEALAKDGSSTYAVIRTAEPCQPATAVTIVRLARLAFTDPAA